MTDTIDNGVPAFPHTYDDLEPYVGGERCAKGMSLRDYFAAMAMAAIISKYPLTSLHNKWNPDALPITVGAYEYADAMLAARKQTGDAQL